MFSPSRIENVVGSIKSSVIGPHLDTTVVAIDRLLGLASLSTQALGGLTAAGEVAGEDGLKDGGEHDLGASLHFD